MTDAVPPQAITADERQAAALVNAMAEVKRHIMHSTTAWVAAASDDVVVSTIARTGLIRDILTAAVPHLTGGQDQARAEERERIRRYVTSRSGGLNPEDPYERGKDMAYLSVLQYLEGQP